MNILWLCNDNTANIPYTFVEGINRYTRHTAKMVQLRQTYLKYPTGLFGHEVDLPQLISQADVIHLNESFLDFHYSDINILNHLHDDQKVFRHGHGTYLRQRYEAIKENYCKHNIYFTCSTPDLIQLLPHSTWLPAPIPLDDEMYQLRPIESEKLKISHSPTNREIKSSDLFERVVDSIPLLEKVLITRKPHSECMQIKRECHIHYDQMVLGAYGVSALEALAMGQICLVGVSPVVKNYIGEHPFVNVSEGILRDRLQRVVDLFLYEVELKDEMILRGREWLERYHDLKKLTKYLVELYEKAGYFRK